jgi:hypothetical protein
MDADFVLVPFDVSEDQARSHEKHTRMLVALVVVLTVCMYLNWCQIRNCPGQPEQYSNVSDLASCCVI